MPNFDIATPVSSAPTDRLALGVGLVRPGVAGTLNPSIVFVRCLCAPYVCFEGNDESHPSPPLSGVFNPCCRDR